MWKEILLSFSKNHCFSDTAPSLWKTEHGTIHKRLEVGGLLKKMDGIFYAQIGAL